MVYNVFDMLLIQFASIFVEETYKLIQKGYGGVVFFSCDVGLLLGSPFCSINLFVYFFANTHCFDDYVFLVSLEVR